MGCKYSPPVHFWSACTPTGFFFTKDLDCSHARAPGPPRAKPVAPQSPRMHGAAHGEQEEQRFMRWACRARGELGEKDCRCSA